MLLKNFFAGTDLEKVLKELQTNDENNILINGIDNPVNAYFALYMMEKLQKNIIIVENNLYNAQKTYDTLNSSFPNSKILFYPVDDFVYINTLAQSLSLLEERINTLIKINEESNYILVTHTTAITRYLPPYELWKSNIIKINYDSIIENNEFLTKLINNGYKRVHMVENVGEFSIRGGIIDIFPITYENPVRIELFDTDVDSIRVFSIDDQRTIKMIDEVTIPPAEEFIYSEETLENAISKINHLKKEAIDSEAIESDIERLYKRDNIAQLAKYFKFFYEEPASLYDYVQNGIIYYSNFPRIRESYSNLIEDFKNWFEVDKNNIISNDLPFYELNVVENKSTNNVYTQNIMRNINDVKFSSIYNVTVKHQYNFDGKLDYIISELKAIDNKKTVLITFNHAHQLDRFVDSVENNDISVVRISDKDEIRPLKINVLLSEITTGFEFVDNKFALVTHNELYKNQVKKIKYQSTSKDTVKITSYEDLKKGDYVVHYEHGIGQYLGIQTIENKGLHRDYLQIIYKGEDKLYIPIENIDLIQKYVGSEGHKPKIHKIGGVEWTKTKQSVQKKIKDIAANLIKLYAEREQEIGFAYSKDSYEQINFENDFMFTPTIDQLTAIEEIKQDMELQKPMDRLLCGDVGYGKTEVAMRAAFKAVMNGKQVAYLAPTTILTQQHYQSFLERFKNFPINIGLLNRFVPKSTQTKTIHGINKGTVDIVIGTHRLLSKDIEYKDLGLLIVDEEQRFGVEQKEKIKQLKVNIDVLTLSATPIPRTLQMGLVGIRGLSTLNTPPANRYPVQTYVLEYNKAIIKEAIERELARGGQVFYLYNKTSDIDREAMFIQELVPDAKVTFAHGKMSREELEDHMIAFLDKKYDILVSTTIIETGIDIANANTLIIKDADKLGLSQLYQLRGRVGRSDRIAYAYLMYPKNKVLTEIAEKRLTAIKDFTELGSGYKIAMRDLSIRGAGDLLGTQQYGFIDTVGFEMYNKMLKDAFNKFKGIKVEEEPKSLLENNVKIIVKREAYIPDHYIEDESIKIYAYKKIKNINNHEDVIEIENELIDRFGEYPEAVQNLINISFIRNAMITYKIESLVEEMRKVNIIVSSETSFNIDGEKLFTFCNALTSSFYVKFLHNKLHITYKFNRIDDEYLTIVRKLFAKFSQLQKM